MRKEDVVKKNREMMCGFFENNGMNMNELCEYSKEVYGEMSMITLFSSVGFFVATAIKSVEKKYQDFLEESASYINGIQFDMISADGREKLSRLIWESTQDEININKDSSTMNDFSNEPPDLMDELWLAFNLKTEKFNRKTKEQIKQQVFQVMGISMSLLLSSVAKESIPDDMVKNPLVIKMREVLAIN